MFRKRIGITQKVMVHPEYPEVMDCLDTNWARLLSSLDILAVPVPLMPAAIAGEVWDALQLDGLILSGGNSLVDYADPGEPSEKLSPERDAYERELLDIALTADQPILGVCRGMQIINTHFGGGLTAREGHAGTRHPVFQSSAEGWFDLPDEVNSYHQFAISESEIGSGLVSLAVDEEGYVEAFGHRGKKVLAIMWHPEREWPPQKSDCELIRGHFGI